MSAPLSPQFIAEIKQHLLEDKVKFEKELGLVEAKNPNEADDLTAQFPDFDVEESDEGSSAAEVAEYELNMNVEADLKKAYRDTVMALKKIEDGTYGICKYCKKDIGEDRLRARPTSSSCVECKKAILQEA